MGCALAAATLDVRRAAARPLTCFDPKSHRFRTALDDKTPARGLHLESFWQLTYLLTVRTEQTWASDKKPIVLRPVSDHHPSLLGHISRVSAKKCAGTRIVGVCGSACGARTRASAIIHNRDGGCHVRGLVAYREGVRDLRVRVRDRTRER